MFCPRFRSHLPPGSVCQKRSEAFLLPSLKMHTFLLLLLLLPRSSSAIFETVVYVRAGCVRSERAPKRYLESDQLFEMRMMIYDALKTESSLWSLRLLVLLLQTGSDQNQRLNFHFSVMINLWRTVHIFLFLMINVLRTALPVRIRTSPVESGWLWISCGSDLT